MAARLSAWMTSAIATLARYLLLVATLSGHVIPVVRTELTPEQFIQSCSLSQQNCQSTQQCEPARLPPGKGYCHLGYSVDITEYNNYQLSEFIRRPVFNLYACNEDSPSGRKSDSMRYDLQCVMPCQASVRFYDPPSEHRDRDTVSFLTSMDYSRSVQGKLGLLGVVEDVALGFKFQYSQQQRIQDQNNYVFAENRRRVVLATGTLPDFGCLELEGELAAIFAEVNESDPDDPYFNQLLKTWGTHFITAIDYGGSVLTTAYMDKCSLKSAYSSSTGAGGFAASADAALQAGFGNSLGYSTSTSGTAAISQSSTSGGVSPKVSYWRTLVDKVPEHISQLDVSREATLVPIYELVSPASLHTHQGEEGGMVNFTLLRQTWKEAWTKYIAENAKAAMQPAAPCATPPPSSAPSPPTMIKVTSIAAGNICILLALSAVFLPRLLSG
eukprot:scpid70508/ scgid10129/ 